MTYSKFDTPQRGSLSGTLDRTKTGLPSKWNLLSAVEQAREPLGLKSTSLALLRALVSLIQSPQIAAHRDADHISFASNATLAERAHVSVQTVERHIARLVNLGLVARHTSGNGKRWARRDRHGEIAVVSGLSILPLATRHAEFLQRAEQHQAMQDRCAALRDKCRRALTMIQDQACLTAARLLLRRKATEAELNDLLSQLETDELRAQDTQIEGHKDPNLIPDMSEDNSMEKDVRQSDMERAFPKLCSALRFARTQGQCLDVMQDKAHGLSLGQVWPRIQRTGATLSFVMLGYLLEKAEKLRNPAAYATALLMKLQKDPEFWRSLINPSVLSHG